MVTIFLKVFTKYMLLVVFVFLLLFLIASLATNEHRSEPKFAEGQEGIKSKRSLHVPRYRLPLSGKSGQITPGKHQKQKQHGKHNNATNDEHHRMHKPHKEKHPEKLRNRVGPVQNDKGAGTVAQHQGKLHVTQRNGVKDQHNPRKSIREFIQMQNVMINANATKKRNKTRRAQSEQKRNFEMNYSNDTKADKRHNLNHQHRENIHQRDGIEDRNRVHQRDGNMDRNRENKPRDGAHKKHKISKQESYINSDIKTVP